MRTLVILAVAVALGATPAAALADQPGRGWLSQAKVRQIMAAKGYRVTKVEADDGHWEGKATRADTRYEFHVDPRSGRITKLERDRD